MYNRTTIVALGAAQISRAEAGLSAMSSSKPLSSLSAMQASSDWLCVITYSSSLDKLNKYESHSPNTTVRELYRIKCLAAYCSLERVPSTSARIKEPPSVLWMTTIGPRYRGFVLRSSSISILLLQTWTRSPFWNWKSLITWPNRSSSFQAVSRRDLKTLPRM